MRNAGLAHTFMRTFIAAALGVFLAYPAFAIAERAFAVGDTITSVTGLTRESLVKWLEQHEHDNYYLGTPYVPEDWRSPNGDINSIGEDSDGIHAGMNCTGFVYHALCKAAEVYQGLNLWPIIPGTSGWRAFYTDHDIQRRAFNTKEEMMSSGYLDKGDIIWAFADQEADNSPINHVGIFWGNTSSEDKFWHSANEGNDFNSGVNRITMVEGKDATPVYVVIKLGNAIGRIAVQKGSSNSDITNGNPNYSLAGATYGIYEDNHCTRLLEELITDSQGRASSGYFSSKRYYVKETKAPPGYALDSTVYPVDVERAAVNYVNSGSVNDVPQNNPLEIAARKYDADKQFNAAGNSSQGEARLNDAEFTVKYFTNFNASGSPARTWVLKTDGNGVAKFADSYKVRGNAFYKNSAGQPTIPLGSITIQETSAPYGYVINTQIFTFKITASGTAESLNMVNAPSVPNAVLRGGVEVEKRDSESKAGALGGAKLDGTVFEVRTENDDQVKVGGTWYSKGSVVATLTTTGSSSNADGVSRASTSSNALPCGLYSVKEVAPGNGYFLTDSESRSFRITKNGQMIKYTGTATPTSGVAGETPSEHGAFFNKVMRGDLEFIKVRESDMQRLANVPFKLTSETTNESHVLVTDENGYACTASSWNSHSLRTNENDSASANSVSSMCGIWFGRANNKMSTANDKLGALPYDTYTLEEMRCAANEGLSLIKVEHISIKRDGVTVKLGTIDDRASELQPYIHTAASDAIDGDKLLIADRDALITDHVEYMNLDVGKTYTLKASLVDKSSGATIDGTAAEKQFKPGSANGHVEIDIPAGMLRFYTTEVVVFEELLLGDAVQAEHKDLNDSQQTVRVITSKISTYASDQLDSDKSIVASRKASIVDVVEYKNLVPDKPYRVEGCLVRKEYNENGDVYGEPVVQDGTLVNSIVDFTPEYSDGVVSLEFCFDASELAGCELVALETLIRNGEEVAWHNDINDYAQTVSVVAPNVATTATDGFDGDKTVVRDGEAAVVDAVKLYNVIPGETYTSLGLMLNVETGLPILNNNLDGDGRTIVSENELRTFYEDLLSAYGLPSDLTTANTGSSNENIEDDENATEYGMPENENDSENSSDETPSNAPNELQLPISPNWDAIETLLSENETLASMLVVSKTEVVPESSSETIYMEYDLSAADTIGEAVICDVVFAGDEIVTLHSDVNNEEQTVNICNSAISTTATDRTDGDKSLLPSAEASILDNVVYTGLLPGQEYEMCGTIMDAATGRPLLVNDKAITSAVKFTPNSANGNMQMLFQFDASKIEEGTELVVFELLCKNGDVIAEHTDVNDKNQTVLIGDGASSTTTGSGETIESIINGATQEASKVIQKTGEVLTETGQALAETGDFIARHALAVCVIAALATTIALISLVAKKRYRE